MSELPTCTVCHKRKHPVGRDPGVYAANSYCEHECPGHYEGEQPGSHWPGEACEPMDGETVCFICRKPTEALNDG